MAPIELAIGSADSCAVVGHRLSRLLDICGEFARRIVYIYMHNRFRRTGVAIFRRFEAPFSVSSRVSPSALRANSRARVERERSRASASPSRVCCKTSESEPESSLDPAVSALASTREFCQTLRVLSCSQGLAELGFEHSSLTRLESSLSRVPWDMGEPESSLSLGHMAEPERESSARSAD